VRHSEMARSTSALGQKQTFGPKNAIDPFSAPGLSGYIVGA
jgi:hypothetical protein